MFGIDLPVLWFIIVAVLFAGYFLLEGFDFGVGILLPFIGRDEKRRSAMIRTIGPVWDGNEVWLITAGGALFAAFPLWYATMFSSFYLPLFIILIALIVRIVGLEWRGKNDSPKWHRWCDRGIIFGSWVPPLMWGIAVANLVRGIPVDVGERISTSQVTLWSLLNPYALLAGAALTALFVLHGATFLRLKTAGVLRDDVARALTPATIATVLFGTTFVLWTQLQYGTSWTWALVALVLLGVIVGAWCAYLGRDGWAFTFTAVAVLSVTALVFGSMFPWVVPSTLDGGTGITIWDATSSEYTLTILTWAALAITPVVILYQGWTYWVFRKRILADPVTQGSGY